MKAQETALKPMIEGTRQYAVPLYQRRYAWTRDDWDSFWLALAGQYHIIRSGKRAQSTHFLGSLVVHPTQISAHGVTIFNIIDGQQRLTTAFVLLIALRDHWDDEEERARIAETYLVNKFKKGDLKYKLLPGLQDRKDLILLLDGKPQQTTGQIGQAYAYFTRKLDLLKEGRELDLDDLESALLTRLEVVDITTDSGDNAHRIFQTLNSTGRSLSQVDLLRNHFFMLLPSQAEDAYTKYWHPIESRLGPQVDIFFWSDLIARNKGAEGTSRDGVYRKWSEILAAFGEDESAILGTLEAISTSAEHFGWMVDPPTAPKSLTEPLKRLREWGAWVHYPLTLLVLDSYASGATSTPDTALALRYIESFMVRRMLCGIPTNNLNRLFTTTVAQVRGSKDLAYAVRAALSTGGKYWPTDEELLITVEEHDFYRSQRATQRQFVLRRLEESLSHEHPDWSAASYTIEHIMPQTLTADWWEHLGPDSTDAYEAMLHTLGNLTLTTANAKLSNDMAQRKMDILSGSFLTLNQQIVETGDHWNYEDIRARSRKLGDLAIAEWPGPVADETLLDTRWREVVRAHLAGLSGSEWTTLEDIESVSDAPTTDIREFILTARPEGHERLLNFDGTIDVSLPWVSEDVRAYKSRLASLGILEDAMSDFAVGSHVDPTE